MGGDNRRAIYGAFPGLPTITPRRMVSAGEVVVAEATLDYGGDSVYKCVFVFEFRGGRVKKETADCSQPVDAASRRADWVEKMEK